MPKFEHRHTVGFEETSLVGNVYFTNYLLWQGHCREMFLARHAPGVIRGLERGEVAFLTRSCNCEYEGDWGFAALDDVLVEMELQSFRGGRMTLGFTYRHAERPELVVARGSQELHCKVRRGELWVPAPFAPELVRALLPYAEGEELREALLAALEFSGEGGAEGGGALRAAP